MKRNKNSYAGLITVGLVLLGLLICNIIWNPDFWKTPLYNMINIVIAIVIAYYFSQRRMDERKVKDQIEHIIDKIQMVLKQDSAFNTVFDKRLIKDLLLFKRLINNKISILETCQSTHKRILHIEEDIKYLKEQFIEWQSILDKILSEQNFENYQDESEKRIRNMDDALDRIRITLYVE